MSRDGTVRDKLLQSTAVIARLTRTRFDRRAREIGLTRAQWRTLNVIRYHEGITQSQLAEKMDVENVTVTRSVDILEALGWVQRRPHPTDRRARQLFLTDKVAPILASINKISAEVESESCAGLSVMELLLLDRLLGKIRDNLSRLEPVGDGEVNGNEVDQHFVGSDS